MKFDIAKKRTERPLIENRGAEIAGQERKSFFNEFKRRGFEMGSI